MKKRILSSALSVLLLAGLFAGCSGGGSSSTAESTPAESASASEPAPADEAPSEESDDAAADPAAEPAGEFKAGMITDVGGINDESFNQSAWSGMTQLETDKGVSVSFIESQKDADYMPNLEKMTDEGQDIIWGIGFLMKDAIKEAAEANPDQLYALVDDNFEDGELPNVISVIFKAEQSSFEVGYIAAHMTEANHVGFVVGMETPVMDRFRFGYMAGVQYGAKELGKEIKIDYANIESFADSAKGKATAQKMYTDGADVVFHAAGQSGNGCIEAAKEMDKMVIGVDLDQNKLAPDNVITSSLKNVGSAVFSVTERVMQGENLGGTTIDMGLSEGGVGIAPSSDKHVPADVLTKVSDLEKKIIAGEVEVPLDQAGYDAFVAGLA